MSAFGVVGGIAAPFRGLQADKTETEGDRITLGSRFHGIDAVRLRSNHLAPSDTKNLSV
jgi:hypothetical protein